MADIGRFNKLQIIKQASFGLYLDGGEDGEILLPNRYVPKDQPTEVGDWLRVFVYFDSEDRIIATTVRPRAQVGEFANLKVVARNQVGLFLDWGLPKDVLLPFAELKKPLEEGQYCVAYLYLDKHTSRVLATTRLDRYLDKTPARYKVGDAVNLLLVERTDLGYKAIINSEHWGLLHRNEAFRPVKLGRKEQGYIREIRPDGKINLSLQPVGGQAADLLQQQILERLHANDGQLALSDRSSPEAISDAFSVSKSNFKKAIGGLLKKGLILIHPDRIELSRGDED
ncbi:S1-like domain-containing RNA-binding protein [Halopseudomonas oceani]|uniref:CvfB family protein n=1 Tax=Halopseudomonas oceani TaxID=1708783 RepID=UPI002AA8209F|nr:S1-like domain-containing RNA-binding protein [Halopseudomonas oceani]